jgi:hypothetical protein
MAGDFLLLARTRDLFSHPAPETVVFEPQFFHQDLVRTACQIDAEEAIHCLKRDRLSLGTRK